MAGWIKIHRELGRHWLAQDMEKLGRWVDLLLLASYEDNKVLVGNQVVDVKRGQFIGSLSFLGKRWKISRDKAAAFLRVLEAEGMIIRESNKNVTQITICNYDSYQDVSDTFPTPSLHLLYTSPTPTRQTKEIQEIQEIYNTPTTPACTCVCEEDYIARYRKEGMWQDVAMILHKTVKECMELFDRFIVEYQHNGDVHRDYNDFKKHFIQWARITIQKENKVSNGNNNRQDYSRRGRADVPADISVDF